MSRRLRLGFATAFVMTMVFAPLACGTSTPTGESKPPLGETRSATIGPAGGTLEAADGTLVVTVPPGALDRDVALTVAVSGPTSDALRTYDLGPDGTQFAKPVELKVRNIAGEDLTRRVIVLSENGELFPLDGLQFDFDQGTVSGETTHFSEYRVPSILIVNEYVCSDHCRPGYYRAWQKRWNDTRPGCPIETHCIITMPRLKNYFACRECTPCYHALGSYQSSPLCLDGDPRQRCFRDESTCPRDGGENGSSDGGADGDTGADADAADAATCPFVDQWTGTYSGAASGTWTVNVNSACSVAGTHNGTSAFVDGPLTGGITGTVSFNGTMTLQAAFGEATCPWTGTATATSASGTYDCGLGITGTWSGLRQ